MSGVLGDFPVQLSTRLTDRSSVAPFSKFHKPDTHDLLHGLVASIFVASDTSDTPDFLVTFQRHHRGDVTRMLAVTAPLYWSRDRPRRASRK